MASGKPLKPQRRPGPVAWTLILASALALGGWILQRHGWGRPVSLVLVEGSAEGGDGLDAESRRALSDLVHYDLETLGSVAVTRITTLPPATAWRQLPRNTLVLQLHPRDRKSVV